MEMGTLIFDIDGTICTQEQNYADAKPFYDVIYKINCKYNEGYEIIFFTARGTETGIDWREVTEQQLKTWGVKYHKLLFNKPFGHYYIDDRGISAYSWETHIECQNQQDTNYGNEYLLSATDQYVLQRIRINENEHFNKQLQNSQYGTWHIVEGTGIFETRCFMRKVVPGATIDLKSNMDYQLTATSDQLVIIEVISQEV